MGESSTIKADITTGFKGIGCRNYQLMTEYPTGNPRARRFQCCCGMEYLHVSGDPDNVAVQMNGERRVDVIGATGLPMFGHLKDDCPGAGAPLTCHGAYVWNGVMWS